MVDAAGCGHIYFVNSGPVKNLKRRCRGRDAKDYAVRRDAVELPDDGYLQTIAPEGCKVGAVQGENIIAKYCQVGKAIKRDVGRSNSSGCCAVWADQRRECRCVKDKPVGPVQPLIAVGDRGAQAVIG